MGAIRVDWLAQQAGPYTRTCCQRRGPDGRSPRWYGGSNRAYDVIAASTDAVGHARYCGDSRVALGMKLGSARRATAVRMARTAASVTSARYRLLLVAGGCGMAKVSVAQIGPESISASAWRTVTPQRGSAHWIAQSSEDGPRSPVMPGWTIRHRCRRQTSSGDGRLQHRSDDQVRRLRSTSASMPSPEVPIDSPMVCPRRESSMARRWLRLLCALVMNRIRIVLVLPRGTDCRSPGRRLRVRGTLAPGHVSAQPRSLGMADPQPTHGSSVTGPSQNIHPGGRRGIGASTPVWTRRPPIFWSVEICVQARFTAARCQVSRMARTAPSRDAVRLGGRASTTHESRRR